MEGALEKYSTIPQERLDAILLEMKKSELDTIIKQAETLRFKIGYAKMNLLNLNSEKIDTLDGKIKFWKDALVTYSDCELDSE